MKPSLRFCLYLFALALLTRGLECKDKFKAAIRFAEKFTLTPSRKAYAINDTIKMQFKNCDRNL